MSSRRNSFKKKNHVGRTPSTRSTEIRNNHVKITSSFSSTKARLNHIWGISCIYSIKTHKNHVYYTCRQGKIGSRLRKPVNYEGFNRAYPWPNNTNERRQNPRLYIHNSDIPDPEIELMKSLGPIEIVVIQIAKKNFPVHKEVLANASPFLESKFKYHKGKSGVIKILEDRRYTDWEVRPKPDIFYIILRYVYTGLLIMASWCVLDVYNMADYMLMPEVKMICEPFLIKTVDVDTLRLLANYAEYHDITSLINHCSIFFIRYVEEISQRPDYSRFFPCFIARVFSLDRIFLNDTLAGWNFMNMRNQEVAILDYVLKYLSHHASDQDICAMVFPAVRLLDIKPSVVRQRMRSHRELLRHPEIRLLVRLGRVLYKFQDETLIEDHENCIPPTWRRRRVYTHLKVRSVIPAEVFRLSGYDITNIVIGTRLVFCYKLIVLIQVQYKSYHSKKTYSVVYGDTDDIDYRYEVDLDENEYIIGCKYTTFGKYLNRLEFTTDMGFTYGPLGSFHIKDSTTVEGRQSATPGRYVYLQNLGCVADYSGEKVCGIRDLNFTWITLT